MNKAPTPVVCYLQPSPQPLTAGHARATWLPWPVFTEAMAKVQSARKNARVAPDAPGLKRGTLLLAVGREVSMRLAELGYQNLCLLHKAFELPALAPEADEAQVSAAVALAQRQALEFAEETKMALPWLDVDIVVMLDAQWLPEVQERPTEQSMAVRAFLATLQSQGVVIKPIMLSADDWADHASQYAANNTQFNDPAYAEHYAIVAKEQAGAFLEAARIEQAGTTDVSFAETIMRKQF